MGKLWWNMISFPVQSAACEADKISSYKLFIVEAVFFDQRNIECVATVHFYINNTRKGLLLKRNIQEVFNSRGNVRK